MRNPEDLYEIEPDVPDVSGAVLLYHFDGFMDAGSAGAGVTKYLLEEYADRVVARFDIDELIDYRSRRPTMTFESDHWADYEEPELSVFLLHDAAGAPFMLLTGAEPDVRWERFSEAVMGLVERWDIRLTVGYHGIPMGAPHTRPLGVTVHGTRPELLGEHQIWPNKLQIPGNAAALLELRLGEAGRDALGFAAHVPHYLAQMSYPAASMSLLDCISRSTGLLLPTESLRAAASEIDAAIDQQVSESEEATEVVQALERQYDMVSDSGSKNLLADTTPDLPTAEELGDEFERFLAEQRGKPGQNDR